MKESRKIILASKSPRRIELLKSIGLKFKVKPSSFREIVDSKLKPKQLVLKNACGKARAVAEKSPNSIVIGVDTIGVYKNHILEKPRDFQDAKRILKIINGTTHRVLSGFCVIDTTRNKEITAIEETKVTFTKMTNDEIEAYIKFGESMDKAAAFAVQGLGSLFIKKIDGCYFNVVGLPMFSLGKIFMELNYELVK